MTRAPRCLALLALAGCALAPTPPVAGLAVEVLRGFPHGAEETLVPTLHAAILLDVTRSMQAPGPAGPPRYRAARAAAARLAGGLPDALLDVYALGAEEGECTAPQRVGGGGPAPERDALAGTIRALAPAGEGSLAAALDRVREAFPPRGGRLAVFTDLGGECGGDLCAAAGALVQAGVRLDLVVLGDALPPACLATLQPDAGPPTLAQLAHAHPPATFSVESYPLEDDGRAPEFLAAGQADGRPITLPAGPATVIVNLDPPSRVGPMLLSPGATTTVHLVEFPDFEERVREWMWDTTAGLPR